jgi:hypothetical protein
LERSHTPLTSKRTSKTSLFGETSCASIMGEIRRQCSHQLRKSGTRKLGTGILCIRISCRTRTRR